jgi:hypothetical protein
MGSVTGAVALAVVLVIVVGTLSLAFRANQAGLPSRPGFPGRPPMGPRPAPAARVPRRPVRPKTRSEESPPPTSPNPPPPTPMREEPVPDLLRSGSKADARVISVVDERTVGATTRSRLVLRVEPSDDKPFEAQLRVLFNTPERRAAVKVGGSVAVRYDPENHNKIVLDLPDA